MRCRSMILAFVLLIPAVARSQALVDRVPADALIYFGWSGSQSLPPAFAQSHLKAVLDASNLREVFSDFLPRVLDQIGKNGRQEKEVTDVLRTAAGPMLRHPTAITFSGITTKGKQVLPKIALLCDAGAEAEDMQGQLQKVLNSAREVPVSLSRHDKMVVVSIGYENEQEFAPADAGKAAVGSLLTNPAMLGVMMQGAMKAAARERRMHAGED